MKKSGFVRAGASVVIYHKGSEVATMKMGMGGRAEVYNTEMAGLMMGAKIAIDYISKCAKTLFCVVDNSNSHDLSMQYGFQIMTLFNVCLRSTSFKGFKYMMQTLL